MSYIEAHEARLKLIALVQTLLAAVVGLPLLLLMKLTLQPDPETPRLWGIYVIGWTGSALALAAWNLFGGVIMMIDPSRRVILGGVLASAIITLSCPLLWAVLISLVSQ